MASASGLNILFTKLDKFDGNKNKDLNSWLRNFERCCTIAGKETDDVVKGQLLMLCLFGQALAVAEQIEEEKRHSRSLVR